MGDYIIDTNVLVVASAQHSDSLFSDSDVPPEQRQIVLKWVMDFRNDAQSKLVLDSFFKIWDEYHNKLTRGRDYGSIVAQYKWDHSLVRFVDIAYDDQGDGCLPRELEKVIHDRPDRKFVAVSLSDAQQGGQNKIVNASDSDWYDWEKALKEAGVHVEHLIDDYQRPKWKEKKKRKPKKR